MAGKKKIDGANSTNSNWGGKRVAKRNKTASSPNPYRLSLLMSVEQRDKLDDYAWKNRVSMSEVLRNVIDIL
tara:strand:+ start:25512 stop:25727 length:216 start_codon:yes stop_codon:yes gene_type:complete